MYGNQTVTFVTISQDTDNRDRWNKPATVRTEVEVPGCRFRPMTVTEQVNTGDIATQVWKGTIPPVPVALNAGPMDEVIVDGVTYQIIGGVMPFTDLSGRNVKVTIRCVRRIA